MPRYRNGGDPVRLGKVRYERYMTRILEQGAWRSCIACNATTWSARASRGVSRANTTDVMNCQVCKASLTADAFDAEELRVWRKNFHLSRDAVCTACKKIRPKNWRDKTVTLQCSLCKKALPMTMFDKAKVAFWLSMVV